MDPGSSPVNDEYRLIISTAQIQVPTPMQWIPPQFKQISRAEAEIIRFFTLSFSQNLSTLLSKKFGALFNLPADSIQPKFLSILDASLRWHDTTNVSYALIKTANTTAPLIIEIENEFIRRAIKALLGNDLFNHTNPLALTDVEHGLFAFLMLKLLRTFNKLSRNTHENYQLIETTSSLPHRTNDTKCYGLNFEIPFNHTKHAFRVIIPITHPSGARASTFTKNHYLNSLPLMFSVQLAHTSTSMQEVQTVALGDVIIFSEASVQHAPHFLAKIHCSLVDKTTMGFSATLNAREQDFYTLTFDSTIAPHVSIQDLTMEQENNSELIGSIPCTLSIEIARIHLSLAELSNVAPGYILELNKKPSDAVTLLANGAVIGKGELVDIEGILGVRVLALGQKHE